MPTPSATPFDEDEWNAGAQGSPRFEFVEDGAEPEPKAFNARDYDAPRETRFEDFDDRQSAQYESGPQGFQGQAHRPRPEGAWTNEVPDSRMWATIGHAAGAVATIASLGIFGWLTPLLIWLTRRDYDVFAAEQAKEALNFQITMALLSLIAWLLTIILIGFPMLVFLWLINLICSIQGAVRTHRGQTYRYPWTIRLIPPREVVA